MAKMIHSMIRVLDEVRSVDFYSRAFGLTVADRLDFDGFTRIHLPNADSMFERELTVNREVRDRARAARILRDDCGKVKGAEYFDKGGNLQMQKARLVCVVGNSFESSRRLLNSGSAMFPDGLANSSGQVGRDYMRHMAGLVYAAFEGSVKM